MKLFNNLSIFLIAVSTFAIASDSYTTEYRCFNEAETTGASLVSIIKDSSGNRVVDLENRGVDNYVPLTLREAGTGATVYDGKGVSVNISERNPDIATVTLSSEGLTYNCQSAEKNQ